MDKQLIFAEMLKAGGEIVIHGLHAVLTAVRQCGTIPPDWKWGLVVPIWKVNWDRQNYNNNRGITMLIVPHYMLAHLLLILIYNQMLRLQKPEQSEFTPGKSTKDHIRSLLILLER